MSKTIAVFRLSDFFSNKKTLTVRLSGDNVLSYSFYGGWQDSGMGFSTSDMGMKKSLPMYAGMFKNYDAITSHVNGCILSGYYKVNSIEKMPNEIQANTKRQIIDGLRIAEKNALDNDKVLINNAIEYLKGL